MLEPHRLFPHLHLRPLKLSLGAMLGGLLLVCVQLVLLQAGLVRAQGTLDVWYGPRCAEAPETVMGEAVRSPILRYELMYPLMMKERLWG